MAWGPLEQGPGEEGPSGTGPPAIGPVRASHIPRTQAPALAPGTPSRSPRAYAAAAALRIQEEQGAPGRAAENYNSQEALRRRGSRRGPIRTKGLARAAGRQSEEPRQRALGSHSRVAGRCCRGRAPN